MIRDKIISEANKFRPYLDTIADQEDALKMARKNVLMVKKELHKRPMELAQNSINFISTLSEYQTSKCGIQNIVAVIFGDRNVVGKHRMLDTV